MLARVGTAIALAFNRTSMELKLLTLRLGIGIISTFNRTSMELKLIPETYATSFPSFLLIEPVWN